MKYLKGTSNYGLRFVKSKQPLKLTGFTDSDWGNSGDRRSISGYCFRLSEGSSLISWKSRKQPTVALSTCEAEYIAMSFAIQESKHLNHLLSELMGADEMTVDLHVDNKGAIDLAKNPINHQRSKHIDIRYHYIRSQIQSGRIKLHYIPTSENIADIFTKPATKKNLMRFKLALSG